MSDPRCFGKESKRPPRMLARQAGDHISNVDTFSLFGCFLQRYINSSDSWSSWRRSPAAILSGWRKSPSECRYWSRLLDPYVRKRPLLLIPVHENCRVSSPSPPPRAHIPPANNAAEPHITEIMLYSHYGFNKTIPAHEQARFLAGTP